MKGGSGFGSEKHFYLYVEYLSKDALNISSK